MGSIYDYMRSYMDPASDEARRRYISIRSFFNWAVKEELIPRRRKLNVLDLCAGTGIAGAALLETLGVWGIEGSLTLIER